MTQTLTTFLTSPTTLSAAGAVAAVLLIGVSLCRDAARTSAAANPVEEEWRKHERRCAQCRRAMAGDEVAVPCADGRAMFRASISATYSRLVREQQTRGQEVAR